jgi:hypothetical protein
MTAISSLNEALDVLERNSDSTHLVGPASDSTIELVEARLGVILPPSYKTFLARVGGGSIGGYDIYGVMPDAEAPGSPNVIWGTETARASFGLPHQFVPLVEFDDSSALALDTGRTAQDGESPVVRLWPGEEGDRLIDRDAAPNFGAFLLDLSRRLFGA